MGAIAEVFRGAWASAMWLVGVPFVNMRIVRHAQNKDQARAMINVHIAKFIQRCGVKIVVDGTPPTLTDGYVLCYNEASFMDVAVFPLVMWPYIDRVGAADIYAYFPHGRAAMEMAGFELVPRGNRAGTDKLLEKIVAAVKDGERVGWGGEGRIVGIDGVGRFKIGASLIAIRAQAPIVPAAFFGGHHIMPFPSLRAKPGTVYVRFGPPIPTDGLVEEDARALADLVQKVFAGMYEDLRKKDAQAAKEDRP